MKFAQSTCCSGALYLKKGLWGLLTLVMGIGIPMTSPAQLDKLAEKGHAAFAEKDYRKAISIYNKSLARKFNKKARINLSQAYYFRHQFPEATQSFVKLVQLNQIPPHNYLDFADILMRQRAYSQAPKYIEKFQEIDSSDVRGANYAESLRRLPDYYEDSSHFTVKKLPWNVSVADFAPFWFQDTLAFISARKSKSILPVNRQIPQEFDVWLAKRERSPEMVKLPLKNGPWGPMAYDSVHKELFVTVMGSPRSKVRNPYKVRMQIYVARQKGDGWDDFRSLPINNPNFNVGHPAVTPDGMRLYYASDNPGGQGGTDLYYVDRQPDGLWGEPVSLPDAINTPGDELFPTVDPYGLLCFSSDGHGGLGGLDIFYANGPEEAKWFPTNPGAPINSSQDDYSLLLAPFPDQGFLASERSGKGDIYRVKLDYPLTYSGVTLFQTVKNTENPLAGTTTDPDLIDDFISEDVPEVLANMQEPIAESTTTESDPSDNSFLESEGSSEVIDVIVTDTPPNEEVVAEAEEEMAAEEGQLASEEVPVASETESEELVSESEESAEESPMENSVVENESSEMVSPSEEADPSIAGNAPAIQEEGGQRSEMGRFSIQLGAFSRQPAPEFFEQLGPYRETLWTEDRNGLTVYRLGHIKSREIANQNLKRVKGQGFSDAYIYEAPEESIANSEVVEPDPAPIANQVETKEDRVRPQPPQEEAIVENNTENEMPEEAAEEEEIVANEESDPAPEKTALEPMTDHPVFFTVQIGAFRNSPDPSFMAPLGDLSDQLWSIPAGDFRRYSIGKFTNFSKALGAVRQVKTLYPDAFLTAYQEDKKIKVEEAIELLRP